MSAGIARVNGNAAAGAFYGYQPTFYMIAGTNVGTANSGGGTSAIVEGNFEKALRAVQLRASIVFVGPRSNNGFLIAVDATTASAYNTANTDTDVAAALQALVRTATGVSGATVTAKTLTLADFA